MASHISTALLSFLVLCSNAIGLMAATDLDFHYLVIMWPGSFCKKTSAGCCLPKSGEPELDFFMIGLLPSSRDGTILTTCNNSPFHINELSDLEEELNSYWANIKCPSSDGGYIWRNTWKRYGVCSGLSEHDYFKAALDLRRKIDMLSIFKRNGIISTDYADYSFSDVKAAITNGIGTNAAIRCSKNMWEESIIYEIYMCVNKDGTRLIPCPVLPTFTCAERVVFGAFTYDMLNNETSVAANPIKMRLIDN